MHARLKWLLPAVQLLIAVALLLWASVQERRFCAYVQDLARQDQFVSTYGYMAPAKQILHAINFPALVCSAPFTLLESGSVRIAGYLVLVALLWFWIGSRLQGGPSPPKRIGVVHILADLAGLLIAVAVGFSSVVVVRQGHTMLVGLAGVAWSAVLGAHFLLSFRKRLITRHISSGPSMS